jgi:hypothetical protein
MRKLIKNIGSRLKAFLRWFRKGIFVHLSWFLTLVIIPLLPYLPIGIPLVGKIRIYGLLLELIGTGLIIFSLIEKLKIFKMGDFWKYFFSYWREFPFFKGKVHNVNVEAKAGALSIEGYAPNIAAGPEEDDLKAVIKYFKEQIEYLNNQLSTVKEKLSEEISRLNSDLIAHKAATASEIVETKRLITKVSVSDISRDFFGVVCLFVGLILSAIPDYFEKLYYL